MARTPVIAVFDVGKTNKKLFLFDENYRIVEEQSQRFEEMTDEEFEELFDDEEEDESEEEESDGEKS